MNEAHTQTDNLQSPISNPQSGATTGRRLSPNPSVLAGYPGIASPAVIRAKPFDEDLRARLERYQLDHKLSNAELGKKLDVHATAISKYINKKPEGDVAKLESIAADVLKTAETIRRLDKQPRETAIARKIAAEINTARKTNDFCVISGPAGLGKTKGAELYVKQNPSAILITAAKWCCNATQIARALWDALETSAWKPNEGRKIDFLINKLKGSDRPLLVDNAHRLRPGALEYLFDFHDETDIPVCLIGNPEVVSVLRRNDQQFSRIGSHKQIRTVEDPKETARIVIGMVAPDFDVIIDLACKVIQSKGHARALRKQLSLAAELYSKQTFRDDIAGQYKKQLGRSASPEDIQQEAFKAAHQRLIRDYDL